MAENLEGSLPEVEEESAPAKEESAPAENASAADEDFEALIENDLALLREKIPELADISDISELENPVRYGALRDLGLSPEEAYRATTTRTSRQKSDNRAHLRSAAPRVANAAGATMSYRDMEIARELFPGESDAEIQKLYKKVTR